MLSRIYAKNKVLANKKVFYSIQVDTCTCTFLPSEKILIIFWKVEVTKQIFHVFLAAVIVKEITIVFEEHHYTHHLR